MCNATYILYYISYSILITSLINNLLILSFCFYEFIYYFSRYCSWMYFDKSSIK